MLIIKLGGTKLETIHTLGIGKAADFVKTEQGLSITLALWYSVAFYLLLLPSVKNTERRPEITIPKHLRSI